MRVLQPPVVYISEYVSDAPREETRARRLLPRMARTKVRVISDQKMNELVAEHGWDGSRRRNGQRSLLWTDLL